MVGEINYHCKITVNRPLWYVRMYINVLQHVHTHIQSVEERDPLSLQQLDPVGLVEAAHVGQVGGRQEDVARQHHLLFLELLHRLRPPHLHVHVHVHVM